MGQLFVLTSVPTNSFFSSVLKILPTVKKQLIFGGKKVSLKLKSDLIVQV